MRKRLYIIVALLVPSILFFALGRFSASYDIHIIKRGNTCEHVESKLPLPPPPAETPPPPLAVPPPGAKVDIDFAAPDSPYQGEKNAPIIFAEFSDFQCSFCKKSQEVVNRVMSEYKGKVKRVFKNNPLPFHQDAMLAHQAAMAAHEQGKFWEMMNKIFGNQQNIKENDLLKYAKEVGLNMKKFERDWKSDKIKDKISRDMAEAQKAGVTGTPTFFINGRKHVGAAPFEIFKSIIDEELGKGG